MVKTNKRIDHEVVLYKATKHTERCKREQAELLLKSFRSGITKFGYSDDGFSIDTLAIDTLYDQFYKYQKKGDSFNVSFQKSMRFIARVLGVKDKIIIARVIKEIMPRETEFTENPKKSYSMPFLMGVAFALWLLIIGFVVYMIVLGITTNQLVAVLAVWVAIVLYIWRCGKWFFPS